MCSVSPQLVGAVVAQDPSSCFALSGEFPFLFVAGLWICSALNDDPNQ